LIEVLEGGERSISQRLLSGVKFSRITPDEIVESEIKMKIYQVYVEYGMYEDHVEQLLESFYSPDPEKTKAIATARAEALTEKARPLDELQQKYRKIRDECYNSFIRDKIDEDVYYEAKDKIMKDICQGTEYNEYDILNHDVYKYYVREIEVTEV